MLGGEAPLRRQHLAAELLRRRRTSGLSQIRLAQTLGWSQSRVHKLEHGLVKGRDPNLADDVAAWAQATGASPEEVDQLREIASQTNVEALALRGRTFVGLQREVAQAERAARLVRCYVPSLIPGLLQTHAYIEALFATRYLSVPLTEEGLNARLERQSVLFNESKRFEFVLGEVALRWEFGTADDRRTQLERLLRVSEFPNVSIRVLPVASATLLWFHEINLYEDLPRDTPWATAEVLTAVVAAQTAEEVERYRTVFGLLWTGALNEDGTRRVIAEIVRTL